MLPEKRLKLAIDIKARSYRLLRWMADAIDKGFILVTRAHEYADETESTYDWIEQHYQNLPPDTRPDGDTMREFANFFTTYLTSSFDFIPQPGKQLKSYCGCYCKMCAYIANAPRIKPKKLTNREKRRALNLMVDRVMTLAVEAKLDCSNELATSIVEDPDTRRDAGYSAYGHWLIKRTEGLSDGASILALWREIAWNRQGSPIKNFDVVYKDFVAAEESLIEAIEQAGC